MDTINKDNSELLSIMHKMKERNWPTDNLKNNMENIKIKQIPAWQSTLYILKNGDPTYFKASDKKIYYTKGDEAGLREKLLLKAASKKTLDETAEAFVTLSKETFQKAPNFTTSNATILWSQAVDYLGLMLYEDDIKKFNHKTLNVNYLIPAALLVETVGIDKFANKIFNADYTCLTEDVIDVIGKKNFNEFNKHVGKVGFKTDEEFNDLLDLFASKPDAVRNVHELLEKIINFKEKSIEDLIGDVIEEPEKPNDNIINYHK